MGTQIFITVVDWVASIFVSAYYVVKNLGISLLGYLLIFTAILLAIRLLSSLSARAKLVRRVKKLFRAKGVSPERLRSPLRSFFWRFSPYSGADFRFSIGDKTYAVKLFPGFTKGWRVLFCEGGKVTLSRLFWKKRFSLAFDDTEAERVLVFSPAPKGFFEPVSSHLGRDVFPLDPGRLYEGAVFFDQGGFLRQLDRILDGYVDSFFFENQKSEEDG